MPAELRLQLELLERLAERIADLVADRISAGPPLLDAEALARLLGVKRSYVYEHADELGAVRLGDGRKARLRFDAAEARRRLSCSTGRESKDDASAVVEPIRRACRRRPIGTGPDLLPVRGSENAKEEP
jgi:hypothetical protein